MKRGCLSGFSKKNTQLAPELINRQFLNIAYKNKQIIGNQNKNRKHSEINKTNNNLKANLVIHNSELL